MEPIKPKDITGSEFKDTALGEAYNDPTLNFSIISNPREIKEAITRPSFNKIIDYLLTTFHDDFPSTIEVCDENVRASFYNKAPANGSNQLESYRRRIVFEEGFSTSPDGNDIYQDTQYDTEGREEQTTVYAPSGEIDNKTEVYTVPASSTRLPVRLNTTSYNDSHGQVRLSYSDSLGVRYNEGTANKIPRTMEQNMRFTERRFRPDGTLQREIQHRYGSEKDGYDRTYSKQGFLKEEKFYKEGREVTAREALPDTEYTADGHKIDRFFYENGDLKNEFSYTEKDGKQVFDGMCRKYGDIMPLSPSSTNNRPRRGFIEYSFKEDLLHGDAFYHYNDNAFHSATKHFENSVLISAKSVYTSGALKSINSFKNGELDGSQYELYPSGTVKSETPYVAGKKEGTAIQYDEEGRVASRETYHQGELVTVKTPSLDTKETLDVSKMTSPLQGKTEEAALREEEKRVSNVQSYQAESGQLKVVASVDGVTQEPREISRDEAIDVMSSLEKGDKVSSLALAAKAYADLLASKNKTQDQQQEQSQTRGIRL